MSMLLINTTGSNKPQLIREHQRVKGGEEQKKDGGMMDGEMDEWTPVADRRKGQSPHKCLGSLFVCNSCSNRYLMQKKTLCIDIVWCVTF